MGNGGRGDPRGQLGSDGRRAQRAKGRCGEGR